MNVIIIVKEQETMNLKVNLERGLTLKVLEGGGGDALTIF